jgi:hypothetical protein
LDEAHEKRVTSLEARLAEFSERIGAYDRLRQQDLSTVAKLKVMTHFVCGFFFFFFFSVHNLFISFPGATQLHSM